MDQQLSPCITGGPERTNDSRFFLDRIICSHSKNKSHDCDQNVKQDFYHGLIAAHIISGETDGLIQIPWQKTACY